MCNTLHRAMQLTATLAFVSLGILAGCPGGLVLGDSNRTASKPSVTAPADRTVECDGGGNQAALDEWLDAATFTAGCGGATLSNDFKAIASTCGATGTVTVTWTVTDNCGASDSDSATFTIVDTTAPDLAAPAPITVQCGDGGTAAALTAWLASATATDICGDVTVSTERSIDPGGCTATITWTATDDCDNAVTQSSTYTTSGDATPPTLTLKGEGELTIECGDSWSDAGAVAADDCDALIRPTIAGAVDLHTPGVYVLSYAARDACGNAAAGLTRTVTVVDTTPPVVRVNEPKSLWPPNHKLETLTLADLATVTDSCEGKLDPNAVGTILDIYSDEPDNDTGDGNESGDIVIANAFTFSVRVERQGGGNGRVYGIRFEVTDSSGNTTEATAFVHVPHDQSGRTAIDDGAASGQIVTR